MYMKMNMITKIKEHVRSLEKGEENPNSKGILNILRRPIRTTVMKHYKRKKSSTK